MKQFDLLGSVRRRGVLLAAHRGACGGNIPCNSAAAYRIALSQHADIIETDVQNSADGELFIMHPYKEPIHIGDLPDKYIDRMPAEEVRKLHLANGDGAPTQYPIMTFGEMLDLLQGECYINIDKFDRNPAPISAEIRRRGMQEQVIVKSGYDERVLDIVEEYGADLPFFLVTRDPEELERIRHRRIRYAGVEMLWSQDTDPLVSAECRKMLLSDGKILWGNSILYDYQVRLSADHSDDTALLGDPATGWGWFSQNGFGIIQTDWTLACHEYLTRAGLHHD